MVRRLKRFEITGLPLVLGLALPMLFGCARPTMVSQTGLTSLPRQDCVFDRAEIDRGGAITVGLSEPVDLNHAPNPENEAERLVFRQVYEGLVRIDCNGDVLPALAESWEPLEDGRVWRFRLRERARFSDGSPLTAEAVRRSWEWSRERAGDRVPENRWPVERVPWIWVHPESIRTLGEDVLFLAFDEPFPKAPEVLVHPALAVVKPRPDVWPVGSGPFKVGVWVAPVGDILDEDQGERELDLLPNVFHANRPTVLGLITFLVRPKTNPRDLLGEGVDLLVVRDRSAAEYASKLGRYRVYALPWDRKYTLFDTAWWEPLGEGLWKTAADSAMRETLAREVVLADARMVPVTILDAGCDSLIQTTFAKRKFARLLRGGDVPPGAKLVYRRGDRDGKRLAERLVAVLAEIEGNGPRATLGLDAWEDRREEVAGGVYGYTRVFADPWLDRLGWVNDVFDPIFAAVGAVHLVETRAQLIVRTGLTEIAAGWDGVPRLETAGWARRTEVP